MADARTLTRQLSEVNQRISRSELILRLVLSELRYFRGEFLRLNNLLEQSPNLSEDSLEDLGFPLEKFPAGDPSNIPQDPLSEFPLSGFKGDPPNYPNPYLPDSLG
ncbi:MAG: hypothetical protein ACFCBU_10070 [Cyanophyceae cyanobacterium]